MSEAREKAASATAWLDEKREEHLTRSRPYRVAWTIAAVTVIAAGAAMVFLPGPALIVLPVGFAMLSLEFAWASQLGRKSLRGAVAAEEAAERAIPDRRLRLGAGVLAIAAFAGLGLIVLL